MIEKTITVDIEKAESATVDGVWAIATKNPDRVGDTIDPKALRANVGKIIPALFGHNHEKIAGYWKITHEKGGRLLADLKLASTALGQMLKTLLDDGVPLSASIAFRGKGSENETGGLHFKELDIFETSIVAVPCNAEAVRVKALSIGLDIESIIQIEASPQTHTRSQRISLKRAAVAIAQVKTTNST